MRSNAGEDSPPKMFIKVHEINCGERLHLCRRVEDNAPYQTATGRELMERGVPVSLSGYYDSAVLEIAR